MLILIYAAACIVACLVIGYISLIVYLNWPDRPIAENISVTPEWSELHLEQPLTFKYRSQTLKLRIKDFELDRRSNIKEITLPDGRLIHPDIEIVDDGGNAVTMDHAGYTLKYFDGVDFRPSDSVQPSRNYKVIRIRSDVPFYCEGLYWVDYNPK
jgi:hypothetical protein